MGIFNSEKPQKILTLVCFSSISTGKFPEHPANPKNNGYQYNWDKNFLMVYVFASVFVLIKGGQWSYKCSNI